MQREFVIVQSLLPQVPQWSSAWKLSNKVVSKDWYGNNYLKRYHVKNTLSLQCKCWTSPSQSWRHKICYKSLWDYDLIFFSEHPAAQCFTCLMGENLVYSSGNRCWSACTVIPEYNWHLRNEMLKLRQLELLDMRLRQSGPALHLNVNISISPPCVHTFMYAFKVTCRPG